VNADPFLQFEKWLNEAIAAKIAEPTAMTLATADKHGMPGARIVLLKDHDSRGFTFYTNYHSHKGNELEDNPYAALLFYWPQLFRQIRISGVVSKIDAVISENYFKERPRESQISAWISAQSQEIESRSVLEDKYSDFDKDHKNREVPYPSFWGGYCVKPASFEFWQGQPNRLHDRICYHSKAESNETWSIVRLSP
jgi:pyridoxamine 5'-phosphate oxidase